MKKTVILFTMLVCAYIIIPAQNVGIGTNNPGSKLSTSGNLSVGSAYANTPAPANGAIIQGSVGIGTSSPHNDAALDLSQSAKTIVLPRMTTAQRAAITSPVAGMFVYDTDINRIFMHDGVTWVSFTTGPTGATGVTGAQGATGMTGAQGPTGVQGATGPQGATGVVGAQGPTGPQGVTGAQGPSGVLANGSANGNTPYWDGTKWITNNSNIHNDGGNVGIGTAAPSRKLDVSGTGRFTGSLTIGNYTLPTVDGTNGQVLKTNGSGSLTWQNDAASAGPVFYNGTTITFNTCPNNLVLENLNMGSSTYARIRFPNNPGCNFKLGGIQGGTAGKMIVIYNDGTGKMGGENQSAGSAAANRIIITGNMNSNQKSSVVTLVYDGDLQRWITVGIN